MDKDGPSPQAIFDTLTAYQRSAALAGAIELDLFSAVAAGATRAADLARRAGASERGVRSLCDYLVAAGFLDKRGDAYALTAASAAYLDRASPSYMGCVAEFLCSPHLRRAFDDPAGAVRRGGTALGDAGLMGPEHPAWEIFARGMGPMAAPQAEAIADLFAGRRMDPGRVLDVAAGHGQYGIALLKRSGSSRAVFLDWPRVVAVAGENARAAGLEGRFEVRRGDALAIDLGGPFDTILVTNFLHHFDRDTCARFLRRARAALAPGGRVVTVESLVNPDRVTPAPAAMFSFVMLVTTAAGDALTREDLETMARDAGFARTEVHDILGSNQQAILSFT